MAGTQTTTRRPDGKPETPADERFCEEERHWPGRK